MVDVAAAIEKWVTSKRGRMVIMICKCNGMKLKLHIRVWENLFLVRREIPFKGRGGGDEASSSGSSPMLGWKLGLHGKK